MITQPRETLNVQDGFWKGVTVANLDKVFASDMGEEPRGKATKVNLLEEYTTLFGPSFLHARKNIQPYLRQQHLEQLARNPSDVEDLDDKASSPSSPMTSIASEASDPCHISPDAAQHTDGDADSALPDSGAPAADTDSPQKPKEADAETHRLYKLLQTDEHEPRALEQWLLGRLEQADSVNDLLHEWCFYWEGRIDAVDNHQDQLILRSLFDLSLQRLMALHNASTTLGAGFMLSDMDTWKATTEKDVASAEVIISELTPYGPCRDANKEFAKLVQHNQPSLAVQECLDKMLAQQIVFLGHFLQFSSFFKHWECVFKLETCYTTVLIEGFRLPTRSKRYMAYANSKDSLLSEDSIRVLHLKSWQIRALLLPGADFKVLTDSQMAVMERRLSPGTKYLVDLHELKPQPVTPRTTYPAAVMARHGSLYKLLGEVKQHHVFPRPIPTPIASPSDTHMAAGVMSLDASGAKGLDGPNSRPPTDTPGEASHHQVPHHRVSVVPCLNPSEVDNEADRPFSPRRSSHSSSARDPTPGIRLSRFSGKSKTPAKRRCSPAVDVRAGKVPRLELTRNDITEEVHGLQAGLASEIAQLHENLQKIQAGVTSELKQQKEDSQRSHEDIISRIKQSGEELSHMRDKFMEQLDNNPRFLKSEWTLDLKRQRKEISSSVQASFKAELDSEDGLKAGLKSEMARLTTKLQGALQQDLSGKLEGEGGLKAHFDSGIAQTAKAIADAKAEFEADRGVKAHVQAVEGQLASFIRTQNATNDELRAYVYSDLERIREGLRDDIRASMAAEIHGLKACLEAQKGPGDGGYLARFLAVPAWQSTQKAYEDALLRAGWMYINEQGNPDDGCQENEGDWMKVVRAFPNLDEEHLEAALDHAHIQAYGFPLPKS